MDGGERVLAVGSLGVAAGAARLATCPLGNLRDPLVGAAMALPVGVEARAGGHGGEGPGVGGGIPVAGDEREVALEHLAPDLTDAVLRPGATVAARAG